MNDNQEGLSTRRRWFIFSAVLVLAIAAYFNVFKAAALIPEFGDPSNSAYSAFGFTQENIGLLMSFGGFAGLFLSIPFAFLLRRIGTRNTLFVIAGSTVIGSFLGIFAVNYWMLLATRIIESIGLGLLAVASPTAVSEIIPKSQLGLANGIRIATFPIAAVIGQSTVPSIYLMAEESWQVVWIAGTVLAALATVYVFFVYKQPPLPKTTVPIEEHGDVALSSSKPDYLTITLLGLSFLLWGMFWTGGFNGFYSTFLVQDHGFDLVTAGYVIAIPNAVNIIAGALVGGLSDKLHTRKWILAASYLIITLLGLFMWGDNLSFVWIGIIMIGIIAGAVPMAITSLGTIAAHNPKKVGLSMAIIAIGTNLGVILGNGLYPVIRTALGGDFALTSFVYLVPVGIVGFIAACLMKDEKRFKK